MSKYICRLSLQLGVILVLTAPSYAAKNANTPWDKIAQQVARDRLEKHSGQPAVTQSSSSDQNMSFSILSSSDKGVRSQPRIRLANYMQEPPATALESTETQPAETATVECGPLASFRETLKRDLLEAPHELWCDTKAVYLNPWNVIFLVGAGGASVALRPEVDDDIEDKYDRSHSFSEDWRDAFGAAGNPITHFALAGLWYWLGVEMQDIKTYETGKRMVSALTITGLSTLLLKVAANTEAPNGENHAWPSGHVSSTMAFATVLNDAYGPVVGVPMYGLTALVAIERMDSREHHFSDVIFGAALGWVIAETVMKEHRPELCGGEIIPYVDANSGNAGVAWLKTLGE